MTRSSIRTAPLLSGFLLALSLAAHAQSTPEAVIRQWVDAFNSGDMAKAGSFNSPSGTSIIDEFAPYTWTGPNAFAEWGAGFEADSKARAITEPKVTMGTPVVQNVTATEAYLVFPAVYTYKQKGVAMRETAHDVVVLRKEGGEWKVLSWSWTGGAPKPAK